MVCLVSPAQVAGWRRVLCRTGHGARSSKCASTVLVSAVTLGSRRGLCNVEVWLLLASTGPTLLQAEKKGIGAGW